MIAIFRDELKYDYLGNWTERNNGNVEKECLADNLKRRGYSAARISRALDKLRTEADNRITSASLS